MNKKYKFTIDGKERTQTVRPQDESKFLSLYSQYNPILIETDQSQQNQKASFKQKAKVKLVEAGISKLPVIGSAYDVFQKVSKSTALKEKNDVNEFYKIYSNKLDNIKPTTKKQLKNFYTGILDIYKNVNLDDVGFRGITIYSKEKTPEEIKKRQEFVKKIDNKIVKQLKDIGELEFKDEGLGIVGGFKAKKSADVLAAALFTPIQFMLLVGCH